MATASQLIATATIINGQGLSTNSALINAISTYQNQSAVRLMGNIFINAYLASNVANAIVPILNTIGSGMSRGVFLIDLYPASITPIVTPGATIVRYGNVLASASKTLLSQATAPFGNGMAGFANSFTTAQGYASSVFDTVASVNMLQGKTYGQAGLGYSSPIDVVTGGVGPDAHLLGTPPAGWGTMYDVTNLNLIGDPYVFGQNLLSQGLGKYGNLVGKLSDTGLDTTNLTHIPQNKTIITPTNVVSTVQSPIGPYEVSSVANVVTTTTVTGSNPDVVIGVYKTITGVDLQAIVAATQFKSNSTQLNTLADYLNFDKVVEPNQLLQLKKLGITSLSEFGTYLHGRIGQRSFKSWPDVSTFLLNIQIPPIATSNVSANTPLLPASVTNSLLAVTGTGSGPFGNPVMSDFFGTCAGVPSAANLQTINSTYNSIVAPIQTAMASLDKAVYLTYLNYQANILANANATSVSTTMVSTNVALVNSALSSLGSNAAIGDAAYYTLLNKITSEVANLNKAGVVFGPGSSRALMTFGQRIGVLAAVDKTGIGSDTVIANLVTGDQYGDTIRAVVAESSNHASTTNNPNPQQVMAQASAQGISVSTYISQNR